MFDSYYLKPHTETQYVTRKVHEHRAPTDESVKLLREMEKAAEEKRISAFRLEGNDFKCVIETSIHFHNFNTVALAVFELNGKRHTAKVDICSTSKEKEGELMVKLRDEVAKVIATEMLMEFLNARKS